MIILIVLLCIVCLLFILVLRKPKQLIQNICVSQGNCRKDCVKSTDCIPIDIIQPKSRFELPLRVLYILWLGDRNKGCYPPQGKTPKEVFIRVIQNSFGKFTGGTKFLMLSFYEATDFVKTSGKTESGGSCAYDFFYHLSERDRNDIKEIAQKNNVKLMVSIGGQVGSGTFGELLQSGTQISSIGDRLLSITKTLGLDGIDIDLEFNDYDSIILLIQYLKKKNPELILSAAPEAATFSMYNPDPEKSRGWYKVYQKCADLIDFLNIQFYNGPQLGGYEGTFGPDQHIYNSMFKCSYNPCKPRDASNNYCQQYNPNLATITTGGTFDKPLNAFGSIIPLTKCVIGKPIQLSGDGYGGDSGYLSPKMMSDYFQKAGKKDTNYLEPGGMDYRTGAMFWAYNPVANNTPNHCSSECFFDALYSGDVNCCEPRR